MSSIKNNTEVWDNKIFSELKHTQWSVDGNCFYPSNPTIDKLSPGVYSVRYNTSLELSFFEKANIKSERIIDLPGTNSEIILKEIQQFWEEKNLFKEYEIAYKRGILLYGPPGSGKSTIINMVLNDLIKNRNGICLYFCKPDVFTSGLRKLREIEPETPIIVLMEDIDEILNKFNQSEILNILDGLESVENIIFLATTNFPKKLGGRIYNRPSRFDKRYLIDHPSEESRRIYIKELAKNNLNNIDLEKWVKDTHQFSLGHINELFKSIFVFKNSYDESIERLIEMRKTPEDCNGEEDSYDSSNDSSNENDDYYEYGY